MNADTRQAIDIDAMEAGPEMDRLVSMLVMEDVLLEGSEPTLPLLWGDLKTRRIVPRIPPYSTDIGAAFVVVEKMGLALIPIERDGLEGYAWAALPVSLYAAEGDGAWVEEAIADSAIAPGAPLAICRAALRVALT